MTQQLQAAGRSQTGWDNLIEQLQASPDRQTFYRGMLDLQCKIVAAEYGALWAPSGNGELQAVAAWPAKLTEQPADHPIIKMLAEAAAGGAERGKSHVLKIEADGQIDPNEPGLGAHVFVTILKVDGKVRGVSTVVADCRDPKVIQTTAPLREMAAGLVAGFEAKQSAALFEREAEQVRSAMSLLAVSQEGHKFDGAALNLVNELARQLHCSRVTIGWIKGKHVKLVSMSDTENLKRHSEEVAHLELAMAECLDQQHPIVYPVPEGAEPLLLHAVVHAHRKVTGEHPSRYVVSLPLRVGDEWIGVLTLERAGNPFDVALVSQLQLIADVVSPHLADRRVTSRWLPVHAWHSLMDGASYLVGPKHVGWKLLGVLAFAALMYFTFGWWTYDVSSEFVFEADESRIVTAPFEAEVDVVYVEPSENKTVKAGDPLAQLDVTEKVLELTEAQHKLNVAKAEYERKLAERKFAEAKQSQAEILQTEAHIKLLQYQVDQATIRAPIDGYVIDGSWKDKIGGVVPQGERMFEIAQLDRLVAKIRVSEKDIDELRREMEKQGEKPLKGLLRTRSEPDREFEFTVDRILPLAAPVEGANVFQVYAKFDFEPWDASKFYKADQTTLYKGMFFRAVRDTGPSTAAGAVAPPDPALLHERDEATATGKTIDASVKQQIAKAEQYWQRADWLRPGIEGIADIHAGRRPWRWKLTHEIMDTIKLWTWWPW